MKENYYDLILLVFFSSWNNSSGLVYVLFKKFLLLNSLLSMESIQLAL